MSQTMNYDSLRPQCTFTISALCTCTSQITDASFPITNINLYILLTPSVLTMDGHRLQSVPLPFNKKTFSSIVIHIHIYLFTYNTIQYIVLCSMQQYVVCCLRTPYTNNMLTKFIRNIKYYYLQFDTNTTFSVHLVLCMCVSNFVVAYVASIETNRRGKYLRRPFVREFMV